MKKVLFFGSKDQLVPFLRQSQGEGIIEFINPNQTRKKQSTEEIKQISSALKILRKLPFKTPPPQKEDISFAPTLAKQIIDLNAEIENLEEEKRLANAEIAKISPFGPFSLDDIAFIEKKGHRSIQFYCVKSSKTHQILENGKEDLGLIYINTEYDLDYFIGIHKEPKSYPDVIEMHIDQSLELLKSRLEIIDEMLYQLRAELKGMAGYVDFLIEGLLTLLDVQSLTEAKQSAHFPIEDALFSIEAWVPKTKFKELDHIVGDREIGFEQIAVEKEDKVPTCMDNKGYGRLGEDLVRIYDIPSPKDKDPSNWVLWAFALFFAMILADGGYGLLYLGLAFFLKKKFPKLKASGKRFLKLLFVIATSCIVWGVLTTSFFGIEIAPQNPISKISVLNHLAAKKAEFHKEKNDDVHQEWAGLYPQLQNAKDGQEMLEIASKEKDGVRTYDLLNEFTNNILLELSLLIGVIHICSSLARYFRRSLANIGWIAFAIGGYLYFPLTLNATSLLEFTGLISKETASQIGIQLIYGGLGAAVILALIQNKLKGIGEIAKVISIFADILSYLRIYALALASTIMARTFNSMGSSVGLILLGPLIFIAGHGINILLGTMGGVIHGLRLNFIEWYHYSFEGEGRLFNPLRMLKTKQE